MASTLEVQDCIDYARTYVKLAPLVATGNLNADEPALSFANRVMKRIINRKYNWDWNRGQIPPFLTVENRDDYPLMRDDIAWLERAYAEDFANTAEIKPRHHVHIRRNLQKDFITGRPELIALDRKGGDINILRIRPIPNNIVYQLFVDYQKKPPRITELTCPTGSFYPIPDEMEDVIKQFFLAFAYELVDKPTHRQALIEAERLLADFTSFQDMEEADTGFAPERPIMWG